MTGSDGETIAGRLAGRTLLLTGASGLLGKAMLGVLLRETSDLSEIRLALRAQDDGSALKRQHSEVLSSEPLEALHEAA